MRLYIQHGKAESVEMVGEFFVDFPRKPYESVRIGGEAVEGFIPGCRPYVQAWQDDPEKPPIFVIQEMCPGNSIRYIVKDFSDTCFYLEAFGQVEGVEGEVWVYDDQPEQIIRPTEHADLLRLIDGLRQTMERRGIDVGEGDAVSVVSAAEFILRNLDSYLREMEEQS